VIFQYNMTSQELEKLNIGKSSIEPKDLMPSLIHRVLVAQHNPKNSIQSLTDLVNFEYTPSLCACIGPLPGEPLCNCVTWNSLRVHKVAVAIEMLQQHTKGLNLA
jgi:hypothetical protein